MSISSKYEPPKQQGGTRARSRSRSAQCDLGPDGPIVPRYDVSPTTDIVECPMGSNRSVPAAYSGFAPMGSRARPEAPGEGQYATRPPLTLTAAADPAAAWGPWGRVVEVGLTLLPGLGDAGRRGIIPERRGAAVLLTGGARCRALPGGRQSGPRVGRCGTGAAHRGR